MRKWQVWQEELLIFVFNLFSLFSNAAELPHLLLTCVVVVSTVTLLLFSACVLLFTITLLIFSIYTMLLLYIYVCRYVSI